MLVAKLLAASIIVQAALHPTTSLEPTAHEKITAFHKAVHTTTSCVANVLNKDSRFEIELTDRIVLALIACQKSARALIDAYDVVYGSGGEQFFMTKYLDSLGIMIPKLLRAVGH